MSIGKEQTLNVPAPEIGELIREQAQLSTEKEYRTARGTEEESEERIQELKEKIAALREARFVSAGYKADSRVTDFGAEGPVMGATFDSEEYRINIETAVSGDRRLWMDFEER